MCRSIGVSGGTVTSDDGVLSVALRPGAVEEPTDVCIAQAQRPPEGPPAVFGPAYRVTPDIALDVPASITYRYELPDDPTTASVGAILREDFEQGEGRWLALPTTRLEPESDLISGSDNRLSMFYGLLDDGGDGPATTSDSDSGTDSSTTEPDPSTSGTTGSATDPSDSDSATSTSGSTTVSSDSAATTDSDPSTGSTGSGDTGPQFDCDTYPPIEIVNLGTVFVGQGSEDIAMTGNGTFVGVSGNQVLESDADGNTSAFAGPLSSGALGLRFDGNGDLFMANTNADTLDRIVGNGSNELYADGSWSLPNGIYPDFDGNIWLTDTLGPGIYRINTDQTIDTIADSTTNPQMQQPNGVVYDADRSILYVSEFAGSRITSTPIGGDGTPGTLTELVDLPNTHGGDGMTMDACGNLYLVNGGFAGAACRLDRIHLEPDGSLAPAGVETLAGDGDLGVGCSSAQFGFGFGDDGDLSLWVTNPNGTIHRVYVGVPGAPIPGV